MRSDSDTEITDVDIANNDIMLILSFVEKIKLDSLHKRVVQIFGVRHIRAVVVESMERLLKHNLRDTRQWSIASSKGIVKLNSRTAGID